MYILSTFEHSTYLESALAALEESGIARENILAVPIQQRKPKAKLLDTIHSSDSVSFMDTGMALATVFAVLGASFGFQFKWGPIIWGLIGAVVGLVLGVFLSWVRYRRKHSGERRVSTKVKVPNVIVLVECAEDHAEKVEEMLWDYYALGVGKLERDNKPRRTIIHRKER